MDDFFKIISSSADEADNYTYVISVNPEHDIFKGHFPGKPVTPGVLTLMMLRRCAEHAKNLGKTRIAYVKDAKYIAPIIPDGRNVVISFSIDDALAVKGDVRSEDGSDFTKVRMTLTKE